MGWIAYLLCAIAALGCCVLLLRAYRRVGARLLLWSGVCFGCFALNNTLVALDLVVFRDADLFLLRNLSAFVGVVALLYGLVMEAR